MSFDVSGCEDASCGDDQIQDPEECDGTDLDGETCESLGYGGGGTLGCSADCQEFDESGCMDACTADDEAQCNDAAMESYLECAEECGEGECGGEVCEAECLKDVQEQLVECFENLECPHLADEADCAEDCADELKECLEDQDCAGACHDGYAACAGEC